MVLSISERVPAVSRGNVLKVTDTHVDVALFKPLRTSLLQSDNAC